MTLRTTNLVQETYDRLSHQYDEAFTSTACLMENWAIIERIETLPDIQTKPVLDLGCGTGLLPDYINFEDYTGIDISDGMITVAKSKHPWHTFQQADMAHLSMFPDQSFAYILSTFGSFSYVMNPSAAIAEIDRLLQPGGKFVLMTLSTRYYKRGTHIAPECSFIGYTPCQLKHLFRHFKDVQVWGINWLIDRVPLVMRFEQVTISKWFPGLCYYLVVEGCKDVR